MLDINADRLMSDLAELSAIGTFKTGVHRPSLSAEHLACCRWLMGKSTAAGLEPVMDGIGNVLGWSQRAGPHLLAGSHLESQNEAGRLDGPLGVLYALEAARSLQEQHPGHLQGHRRRRLVRRGRPFRQLPGHARSSARSPSRKLTRPPTGRRGTQCVTRWQRRVWPASHA